MRPVVPVRKQSEELKKRVCSGVRARLGEKSEILRVYDKIDCPKTIGPSKMKKIDFLVL
jgi:hypothetical protein